MYRQKVYRQLEQERKVIERKKFETVIVNGLRLHLIEFSKEI